jgi:hypothetical protein
MFLGGLGVRHTIAASFTARRAMMTCIRPGRPTAEALAIAGPKLGPRYGSLQFRQAFCKIVGGVASPMLANLYFRRFLLAWKQFGHERELQAQVVNYADDLVICCRPGKGLQAMEEFRSLIARLGLTVNERKKPG